MIYTHVLKVGGMGVRSPLDAMPPATPLPAPPGPLAPTTGPSVARTRTTASFHRGEPPRA
jgi:hypothetical protein